MHRGVAPLTSIGSLSRRSPALIYLPASRLSGRSAEKTAREYPVFGFFYTKYRRAAKQGSRIVVGRLDRLIGKRAGSRYDSHRSGAWIKIKLYQQGSFVIGGYTQPAGERKHMGALLVGVYENGKLKFAGRVGTGFSEKLLKSLSEELNKIAVKACPFSTCPQSVADWIQG